MKKTDNILKSAIQLFVKNMSIIAIILSLTIILIVNIAPNISFDLGLITKLSVSSVILCLSSILIYELWTTNGQNDASIEKEYTDLCTEYLTKSKHLDYTSVQNYLDYEKKRRYDIEYNEYQELIQKKEKLLLSYTGIKNRIIKIELKVLKRKQEHINIKLPFVRAEEFEYLRYDTKVINNKEYSPSSAKKFLNFKRSKKYASTITLTIFGLNILNFGTTVAQDNIWVAVFMTAAALVSLVLSLVSGYNTGYTSISVISKGIYNTGLEYLSKAENYCTSIGLSIYYFVEEHKSEDHKVEEQHTIEEPKQEQGGITIV